MAQLQKRNDFLQATQPTHHHQASALATTHAFGMRGSVLTRNLKLAHLGLALMTLAGDVREGFVEITRHSLALVGLAVVAVSLTFAARPGLQAYASETLMSWLEMRQAMTLDMAVSDSGAARSTATLIKDLPKDQMAVAQSLSRRYKVSPEPIGALVSEAWAIGERSQIAPTLILAVMAIESRFNPFASGSQGGMGLMQIEPAVHSNALTAFGGRLAAFDPLTNLRVGARHLQFLIQQSVSIEDALRLYALDSGQINDEQYVDRVLNEQKQLDKITQGFKTAAVVPVHSAKARQAQL